MSKDSNDAATMQSLDRAIRVLDIVSAGDGLSLTQISRQAGIAPSTVHRILATLEAHGLLQQEREHGEWLIGVRAFQIGSAFLRNRKVSQVARSFMRELMERTEETISLAVEDDDSAVFIVQFESHSAVRTFHRPGSRVAMHASAAGKALLSTHNPKVIRSYLQRAGLPRFTKNTITDPAAFERELQIVKQRGWAVDDEERISGMCCIGAPIFNEYAEALAAVSISGPTARMTPERLAEWGPMVKRCALSITHAVGGNVTAAAPFNAGSDWTERVNTAET
jgi:IclR family transcriptional regulator, acetate operon repressor